jgi:hypothetical protein
VREYLALGVSIAYYVREASIARLSYNDNAGQRGEQIYAAALEDAASGRALAAREQAFVRGDSCEAVLAQGKLARERARVVRLASLEQRARHARRLADPEPASGAAP